MYVEVSLSPKSSVRVGPEKNVMLSSISWSKTEFSWFCHLFWSQLYIPSFPFFLLWPLRSHGMRSELTEYFWNFWFSFIQLVSSLQISSSCSSVGINPGGREWVRSLLGAELLDVMLGWGTADLDQAHLLRNHIFIKYSECLMLFQAWEKGAIYSLWLQTMPKWLSSPMTCLENFITPIDPEWKTP